MQPVITVFCAFTRSWSVERFIDNLGRTNHDPQRTNLAFIIDGDIPSISKQLQDYAGTRRYRSLELQMNTDHVANENSTTARRNRIAFIKNQSKGLIRKHDSDYVLGLEDDTVFSGLAIDRLYQPLQDDPEIGYVEGVQVGRWGLKYIGAWCVDDYHDTQQAWTVLPPKGSDAKDYQEIDGGGFYYYMTPTSLYLGHDYIWAGEPYGPDVNYGLWLKRQGYKCLIDWQSVTGHNFHNNILYPDEQVRAVCYTYDMNDKQWIRHERKQ